MVIEKCFLFCSSRYTYRIKANEVNKYMAFQKLDDIEINGAKLSNIYRQTEDYADTNACTYTFYFHCDLEDEDAIYDLCKKAFEEGKNHAKDDGTAGVCKAGHDRVLPIKDDGVDMGVAYDKKGCNWVYIVK